MTKLKNTKKGMAKKALSISLVAAMLATSNVPVWAAEDLFTDGSSAAVEAPVVEEPAAEVEAFSAEPAEPEETNSDIATLAKGDAITEENLDISGVTLTVNNNDVEGKDVIFGSSLTVGGDINKINTSDDGKLQKFNYGYRIAGHTEAIKTGTIEDGDTAKMSINLWGSEWQPAVGQTIELYIFRDDDLAKFSDVVLGSFRLVEKKVEGTITLQLDGVGTSDNTIFKADGDNYTIAYTGATYSYKDVREKDDKNVLTIASINRDGASESVDYSKYEVTTSGSIKNAGDVMTIRVTPKANSGLTGEFTTKVTVVKRQGNKEASSFLTAELNENLTYEYTGNDIDIPTDKITVKEKSGYADATLPQDVVEDAVYRADGSSLLVTLDTEKVTNFDVSKNSKLYVDLKSGHQVVIQPRDLSKVKVSLGYNGYPLTYIPANINAGSVHHYLVFTAEDGTELNLKYNTDYTYTVKQNGKALADDDNLKSQGVYTVEISAKDGGHCINDISYDFTAATAVTHAESDNLSKKEYYYTGAEIEPGKDIIGSFTIFAKGAGTGNIEETSIDTNNYEIIDWSNNINASDDAYVTVKVLDGDFKDKTFNLPFTIKPLEISQDTVTVPETISYDKSYTTANEYKVPLIVTADSPDKTIVKGLSENDFTVEYKFVDGKDSDTVGTAKNEIHDEIQATITVTNTNYVTDNKADSKTITLDDKTEIVAKALTDSMVKVNPSSYTYTGAAITPDYYVIDGTTVLYDEAEYGQDGEYRFVRCEKNLNVGTATIVVEGANDKYSGTASATFEITPANTADVKVEVSDQFYTGRQVRPRMDDIKVTLNGNDVTDQFELTGEYGENVTGKGTLVLKPVDTTKNFTGSNVTAEFNIVNEIVGGNLYVYDANGVNVTGDYTVSSENKTTQELPKKFFNFDGTEKTFAETLLKDLEKLEGGLPGLTETKATADDFEIKYADNVSGKKSNLIQGENHYNTAYVYAVGKDGSGFTGNETITLADGSKITGVVAYIEFAIQNVKFTDKNVTVSNGVYAGGLQVKPEVLVQINGNTLVEGKDYELVLSGEYDGNHYTNVTNAKPFEVKVVGKGGYEGSEVAGLDWGIDKKDIADCDVAVTNGVVTVMNGYIPVPVTEYTYENNGDGTYTVTANTGSKSYVGSKTVTAEGQAEDEAPEAPVITEVKVNGNNATVVLAGETEGATGYDYVISTDRDCINSKDYDKVNKNILSTETKFTYTQQGVYYAYCHAWKRVNGVKVFSEWSNAYPFVVSAITPEQPVITSVKKSGRNLTVTWTKSANATTGYDIVMGTEMKKVNGEMRPVEYGKAVKKLGPNTFSVTFKSIPKGTYYVALHAHNRTSESGVKVFSPWSNAKKVTF